MPETPVSGLCAGDAAGADALSAQGGLNRTMFYKGNGKSRLRAGYLIGGVRRPLQVKVNAALQARCHTHLRQNPSITRAHLTPGHNDNGYQRLSSCLDVPRGQSTASSSTGLHNDQHLSCHRDVPRGQSTAGSSPDLHNASAFDGTACAQRARFAQARQQSHRHCGGRYWYRALGGRVVRRRRVGSGGCAPSARSLNWRQTLAPDALLEINHEGSK